MTDRSGPAKLLRGQVLHQGGAAQRAAAMLLVLSTALFMIAPLKFAVAAEGGLYRCQAHDAVSLGDNGMLERNRLANFSRETYETFVLDTVTGVVREKHKHGDPLQWAVVQRGSDDYDFVAVPPRIGSAERQLASAARDFIRVRAWKRHTKVFFIRFMLDTVISGTCELIK